MNRVFQKLSNCPYGCWQRCADNNIHWYAFFKTITEPLAQGPALGPKGAAPYV